MSENTRDAGQRGATPATELEALAKRLRAEADKLPGHLREDALAAAETVHEHATAEKPDVAEMTSHLHGLARIAALAPSVNALLAALSNVGL